MRQRYRRFIDVRCPKPMRSGRLGEVSLLAWPGAGMTCGAGELLKVYGWYTFVFRDRRTQPTFYRRR